MCCSRPAQRKRLRCSRVSSKIPLEVCFHPSSALSNLSRLYLRGHRRNPASQGVHQRFHEGSEFHRVCPQEGGYPSCICIYVILSRCSRMVFVQVSGPSRSVLLDAILELRLRDYAEKKIVGLLCFSNPCMRQFLPDHHGSGNGMCLHALVDSTWSR